MPIQVNITKQYEEAKIKLITIDPDAGMISLSVMLTSPSGEAESKEYIISGQDFTNIATRHPASTKTFYENIYHVLYEWLEQNL